MAGQKTPPELLGFIDKTVTERKKGQAGKV